MSDGFTHFVITRFNLNAPAWKNDFKGPDVFVVLDTVRKDRKSWVVWEEEGRTPDVVIELLSESTEKADRGLKMRVYAKLLKVADKTIYTMAQKGALPAFKVGGLWRFRRQDLDAWISERIGQTAQKTSPSRSAVAKKRSKVSKGR